MRASFSSVPRTLSSASCDGETMAVTAAPSAASAASLAATAAKSSRRWARLLASVGAEHPQELQARIFGWRQAVADPTRVRIRLGWHLAVKCVATLAPRLRRHHAAKVAPLAPREKEAHLLAEDLLLADGHLLAHPVAHASNQMLRCDKISSSIPAWIRDASASEVSCGVSSGGETQNNVPASATPPASSPGPNGASTGCECTAAGGGTGAGASREARGLQSSAS